MQRPLSFAGRGQSRRVIAGKSVRSGKTGGAVGDSGVSRVAGDEGEVIGVEDKSTVGRADVVSDGVTADATRVETWVCVGGPPISPCNTTDGEHAKSAITIKTAIAPTTFKRIFIFTSFRPTL